MPKNKNIEDAVDIIDMDNEETDPDQAEISERYRKEQFSISIYRELGKLEMVVKAFTHAVDGDKDFAEHYHFDFENVVLEIRENLADLVEEIFEHFGVPY